MAFDRHWNSFGKLGLGLSRSLFRCWDVDCSYPKMYGCLSWRDRVPIAKIQARNSIVEHWHAGHQAKPE